MRISISPTEFTTATKGEQVQGLRISGAVELQQSRHFRAAEVDHIDRGNALTRLQFAVTRAHADADAAEAFLLSHGKACQGLTGTITLVEDDGVTSVGTIGNGAVADFEGSYEGLLTTFRYELVGGAID